jgi:hypothetical protein
MIAPRAFAATTKVSVEQSQSEAAALLAKHGATQHMIATDAARGVHAVLFQIGGRGYRLEVTVPKTRDPLADEQSARQRWRALLLLLKAKLEHVRMGMSTIEREFLADMMLPGGKLLHQHVAEQLEAAAKNGVTTPPLLMPWGG